LGSESGQYGLLTAREEFELLVLDIGRKEVLRLYRKETARTIPKFQYSSLNPAIVIIAAEFQALIAGKLNNELIPTKNNGIWHANTIRKILMRNGNYKIV